MVNTVRKPQWAGCALRIVPGQLPHRFSFRTEGQSKDVHVTLNERGALVDRILEKSGLSVSMALPTSAFKGVAARAIDRGSGNSTVTLELHHEDADLCIPLLVDHGLHNIAGDWRAWSSAFDLPMLMIEADGIAHPLDEDLARNKASQVVHHTGSITMENDNMSHDRRRNSTMINRRARFLVRRKTGHLGCRMRIEGREIIART